MANRVYTVVIALIAVCAGCGEKDATSRSGSVTVRLPPPRPETPEPGFSSAVTENGVLVMSPPR